MFCTKCGKELHDGDRFCAYCGAEVRETRRSRYDDVVFNPPFRVEAQRRTEEILRSAESPKQEVKKETVSFDWNLDGFPSAQPRKTEAVDFNWDSVIEKKKESRQIKVEKIQPEQEFFFAPLRQREGDTKEVPAVRESLFKPEPEVIEEVAELEEALQEEETTLTIEDLERELFGSDEEAAPAAEAEKPEETAAPEISLEDTLFAPGIVLEPVVNEPTIIADVLFGGAGAEEPAEVPEEAAETILPEIPAAPEFRKADEKFYTYNQKFDAFQELLEKEKERIRELEESYKKEKESMDYTWIGEVFPEPVEVVEIAQPTMTMSVDIGPVKEALEAMEKEAEPAEEKAEVPAEAPAEVPAEEKKEDQEEKQEEKDTKDEVAAAEAAPSKEKLRYSDIFPRSLVNDDGTGPADAAEASETVKTEHAAAGTKVPAKTTIGSIYDDLEEDDEPRRHTFAKIIIGILLILILAEGVIIGAKFLAPDSKISIWANELMLKAVDMIAGGGDSGQTDGDDVDADLDDTEKDVHMDSIIADAAADMETIGEAVYVPDMTFDKLSSYSFEEIPDADNFVDADWFNDSEGNTVTYGQKIMESLIRYYDSWQAVNTDESLVGINSLEIGEIKTGAEGFYVLCRITYAGSDGGEVEKYQTVYLRISDETMIINEIKEDNL